VLLQYALTLQMIFTQPFVNEEIATAVAEKESQSYDCIGSVVPTSDNDISIIGDYKKNIEQKQFNTEKRLNLYK
jgi:hypothetical protein